MYLYKIESSGLDIILVAKDHELTAGEMSALCEDAEIMMDTEGEVRVTAVILIEDGFIDTDRHFIG